MSAVAPSSKSESEPSPSEEDQVVDLRSPLVAAGLALLLPGLGHLYQRRVGKAILFMVCILGTYFYGWALGGGKVVYACWEPKPFRHYAYFCQVWVGLPAWPAMIQATFDAPLGPNFMVPPRFQSVRDGDNDLAKWNRKYAANFELGTVLTMIAGLLNALTVFDAAAGPVGATPASEEEEKKKPKTAAG